MDWKGIVYFDENSPTTLKWKINRYSGKSYSRKIVSAGDIAGYISKSGYAKITYCNRDYFVHRVVWILHYSEIPNGFVIDHVDGDKLNNRINNLRVVTQNINSRNLSKISRNTTGVVGVYFDSSRNRYVCTWSDITNKPKRKYFNVSEYGHYTFSVACDYRLKMLNELNLQGAGYSDRHLANSTLQP